MTSRERVLAALRREEPDRIPWEFSYGAFAPALLETFKEKTGAEDPAEHFNFDTRSVQFKPVYDRQIFHKYFKDPENFDIISEWGEGKKQGSYYHFTKSSPPMAGFNSVNQIEEYPFPDFTQPECSAHFEKETAMWQERGYAVMGELTLTIFEISWAMRGLEDVLMDMYMESPLIPALFDKVTETRCYQAKRLAEAGVDILRLGDDVGAQTNMMMSPDIWRKNLKGRLAEIIQAAKSEKPDILVFYHSDGNVTEIVPELIEIGIDILNPVQPECMDQQKMKKLYGDRLSFWGLIGTQKLMPFGKPHEIKAKIKNLKETVGQGGGLLIAPTHILEPEVPWENIVAFVEAIEEHGYY